MTKLYLTMPQPGETITQGTLVRWLVAEGAEVKEGTPVAELETEKAVFEYESPYEGKIIELKMKEQTSVPVGSPMAVYEVDDQKVQKYQMLGLGVGAEEVCEVSTKCAEVVSNPDPVIEVDTGDLILSPFVRKKIKEENISLSEISQIKCTGKDGRMTKEDILSYIQSGRKTSTVTADEEVIPCSPVRLRIAENMVLSKQTIPHAHTGLTVDMTAIVEYRKQHKEIGLMSLIFPALKKAIQKYPFVNSTFRDATKDIVIYKKLNLGVAIDTERGLYIGVVPRSNDMDFKSFTSAFEAMLKRARNNKMTVQDLTGMTFTFNNYGYYGTNLGVQIILPPQCATLGMGKIERRPWVVGEGIFIRHLAEFTIAFDHRVMDGRDAGQFLNYLKQNLENFSEKDLNL